MSGIMGAHELVHKKEDPIAAPRHLVAHCQRVDRTAHGAVGSGGGRDPDAYGAHNSRCTEGFLPDYGSHGEGPLQATEERRRARYRA
ncbi:hypothetical protein [Streptomyces sp. C8S0]|uniref:hypothetical protein n=1 Tax=Streptomyces sp. C8S0 TaxID=2585716 RepID=UPI00125DE823|nr:hypothetical protein [Streptomyces sp. C8S0]